MQVKNYLGRHDGAFKTAEEAEDFMNLPSIAGCYSNTICSACTGFLDDYTRSSVCTACAAHQVAELHSLDDEQRDILDLVTKGHNVFFTGAAGTGKSTTLKALMRLLDKVGKIANAVASTGIAALLLAGTTIHLFAGWSVKSAKGLPLDDMKRNAWNKKNKKRLRAPDVLVIDEISMVESSMFTRLDAILREVRLPNQPFGGVQLIVSGDFHQLPPVSPFDTCIFCGVKLVKSERQGDRMPEYTCSSHGTWRNEQKWAFACEAWKHCGFICRQLVQIHRQSDAEFATLLNHLRRGMLTDEEEELLFDHPSDFDLSEAVQIYPLRKKVDGINNSRLAALPCPTHVYGCVDGSVWDRKKHPELEGCFDRVNDDPWLPFRAYQDEKHRFTDTLELKESMPVLLLANIGVNEGLVNGTRGRLVGFEPVKLDALPRKRNGSKHGPYSPGLYLGGEHAAYQEHQINTFAKRMVARVPGEDVYWPVVEFENGARRTVYPHCEVTELGRKEPYSLMSRTQIPLTAGWAITIHKSQGMTLSSAVVDADRAWEYGQSYVAMSRVKSLNGLFVQGLAYGKAMMADPTVLRFMKDTFGDSDHDVASLDTSGV